MSANVRLCTRSRCLIRADLLSGAPAREPQRPDAFRGRYPIREAYLYIMSLLKRLTGERLRNYLQQQGYRVSWWPWVIFEKPEAELTLDLEFVIAHLMMKKRDLFFIEIGANDGVSNDPLYPLIQQNAEHWKGVMIEPMPEPFQLLQQNYASLPNVQLRNVAISEQDGERTIYSIRQQEDTFSKAHQFLFVRQRGRAYTDRICTQCCRPDRGTDRALPVL